MPHHGQAASAGGSLRVSRGSDAGNGLRAEDWRSFCDIPGPLALGLEGNGLQFGVLLTRQTATCCFFASIDSGKYG